MELNEILKIALKGGASDIHLKPGLPAMFRVDGTLVPLKNGERLTPETHGVEEGHRPLASLPDDPRPAR